MAVFIVFKLLILGKEQPSIDLFIKITIVALTVLVIIKGILISYNYKKEQKVKKYLMEEIIFNQGFGSSIAVISIFIQTFGYVFKFDNTYFVLFASFILVSLILIFWISFVKIPREAQKYLKIMYPYLA